MSSHFFLPFFFFYSGVDFSTKIWGSFRKRFHNNSSKKLSSSEAQTEWSSTFLVRLFSSPLNFVNERSLVTLELQDLQSPRNIRTQKPLRLAQASKRGVCMFSSIILRGFNFWAWLSCSGIECSFGGPPGQQNIPFGHMCALHFYLFPLSSAFTNCS